MYHGLPNLLANINVKIKFKHGLNEQKGELNEYKYIQQKFNTFMENKIKNGDKIY